VGIARRNRAIGRLLITLFTFSLISLPYVGFFSAVARENFGVEKGSTSYEWLYATWGFGACMGGLAIGTVFVGWDKRRLIRRGFLAFALCLASFALARTVWQALVVGAMLGFAYFGTTTAMATVLQTRLADHERGRVMALWFMAFGGTVPVGNLIFAPLFDAIGARWVLLIGAAWAVTLAWWCNVEGLDRSADKARRQALEADHPASFDEHGYSAGE
jgi:MFS family permease